MPNFRLMKNEIENGTMNVRRTATQAIVTGQVARGRAEKMRLIRKRKGIKLEWCGHVEVESVESERCDLGHDHPVLKKSHFVWNYCELTRADVQALVDFLKGNE